MSPASALMAITCSDSLVVFTSITDRLTATRSGVFSLTLEGPFGREIGDFDNLVLRAARMFTQSREVSFTLEKHLPPPRASVAALPMRRRHPRHAETSAHQ